MYAYFIRYDIIRYKRVTESCVIFCMMPLQIVMHEKKETPERV